MYGSLVDQVTVDLTQELKETVDSLQTEVTGLRNDHS